MIKTRIQVVGKAQNIGAVTITKNLIKNEGFMKLYAGLSASLMRQAIYGTARLGLHRMFSNYLKDRNNGHLTFWMSAGSSLTAGALAGILLGGPADRIRRTGAGGIQLIDNGIDIDPAPRADGDHSGEADHKVVAAACGALA